MPDPIGIRESLLGDLEKLWRTQSDFGAADDRAQVGERDENARIADPIVIQEIARAGVKVVDVERPSA
jgi:hypothetical protein